MDKCQEKWNNIHSTDQTDQELLIGIDLLIFKNILWPTFSSFSLILSSFGFQHWPLDFTKVFWRVGSEKLDLVNQRGNKKLLCGQGIFCLRLRKCRGHKLNLQERTIFHGSTRIISEQMVAQLWSSSGCSISCSCLGVFAPSSPSLLEPKVSSANRQRSRKIPRSSSQKISVFVCPHMCRSRSGGGTARSNQANSCRMDTCSRTGLRTTPF